TIIFGIVKSAASHVRRQTCCEVSLVLLRLIPIPFGIDNDWPRAALTAIRQIAVRTDNIVNIFPE
ncbi:MAG: hypothetical protein WA847_06585, partial [Terriglobales bacterium]